MPLQKAVLYNADSKEAVVTCHFNPSEFTISKSNQWQPRHAAGADVPDVRFGGAGARTLTMSLIFDSYELQTDVRADTDRVLGLMDAPPSHGSTGRDRRPPHVEFGWGSFRSFRAVLTQCQQRFTLFLPDGTPVRATLQVSLQEVPGEAVRNRGRGQNPTSRAAGAHKVRIVLAGDTIDSLAADELGDPSAWRLIADANNLDDPRRLRAGMALLIPTDD